MDKVDWLKPTDDAFMLNKNAHIWLIRYDRAEGLLKESENILSDEEKQRARRFHFKIDRERFSITRSLLKKILGKIISIPAQEIQFNFNKHGKPVLTEPFQKIQFNVSHSGNLGMIAISDTPIGVDVEQFRKEMTTADIAKRFFSKVEVEEFLKLNEDEKLQGFFNCWTRKEAFIKAIGKGLSLPLNTFDVTLRPTEPARLLAVRYKNEVANDWTLTNIKVENGYAAAFIIKAKSFLKNYWYAC
jgi:4'-phosphopantetheinyl transferase